MGGNDTGVNYKRNHFVHFILKLPDFNGPFFFFFVKIIFPLKLVPCCIEAIEQSNLSSTLMLVLLMWILRGLC